MIWQELIQNYTIYPYRFFNYQVKNKKYIHLQLYNEVQQDRNSLR